MMDGRTLTDTAGFPPVDDPDAPLLLATGAEVVVDDRLVEVLLPPAEPTTLLTGWKIASEKCSIDRRKRTRTFTDTAPPPPPTVPAVEVADKDEDVEVDVALVVVPWFAEPAAPLFCAPPFIVTRHLRTSSTAGRPFLSVIGVRVITQVSVIAPAMLRGVISTGGRDAVAGTHVFAVFTVVTVVGLPVALFARRTGSGLAHASGKEKRSSKDKSKRARLLGLNGEGMMHLVRRNVDD